jgi:imidazolonepropionase-like amidohydrolase
MKAVINAHVYPISSPPLECGDILIGDDGRIIDVIPHLEPPSGCEVYDAHGKSVTPGLVEPHCHIGLFDGGAAKGGGDALGDATTPDHDAYYLFNPYDTDFQYALMGGVTTALMRPGSGLVVSGTGFVAKTTGGLRAARLLSRVDGVKMAFGENPKHNFGSRREFPSTRMGVAAALRSAFVAAQNYEKEKLAAKQNKPVPLRPDLELLLKVLHRELPARIHAHRADDIMTILRIKDEFGFDMSLEHATEAYKVVEEVARRKIPCVTGPSFASRDKVELMDETFANPGILERHGITTAITTDAPIVDLRFLRTEASLAYRFGMTAAGALRAITLSAAEIIGVSDRVGSLDVGKDADLAFFSEAPLELTSRVTDVWLEGRPVYSADTFKEEWEKLLS